MSPAHRPRLPRRQDGTKSPKASRSKNSSEKRTTTDAGANAAPRTGKDPREQLAEATARRDAGPDEQRSEALRSLTRDTPTKPAAVRVNDASKVRALPLSETEDSENGTGTTPTAGGGTGDVADDSRQTTSDDTKDNIVAFPGRGGNGRRRGAGARGDRTASGARAEAGRPRASRRKKILTSAAVVLIAAVLFIGLVFFSPLLATRTITVQGAHLTDKSTIEKSLEPLKGEPLTRVTTQEVQDKIGNDIVVQDVSIEAHPPHELVVTVHERAPVAVVKSGDQYIMVDRNGVAIGAKKSVEEAGVPLLDGGPDAVKSDSFSSAVQALQTLPQSLLSQLNKVEAESSNDIRLDLKDGSTVVWGTGDDSEYKAEVLTSLVKGLKDTGGASVYDVSSPDHPVTT